MKKYPTPRSLQFLFFFILSGLSSEVMAGPPGFRETCAHLVDRMVGSMGIHYDLPFGTRRFRREFLELTTKYGVRRVNLPSRDYLDRVFSEWVALGDPEHHLSVLKYPIPQVVLDVLLSAIHNKISPEALHKLALASRPRPTQAAILNWVANTLKSPRFENEAQLEAMIDKYMRTRIINKNQVRYVTGVPFIPEAQAGHVRMYKGTNFYRWPSISQSMVGKPLDEILDGGIFFLDRSEARVHSIRAEAFHPDGVSVSTDRTVILNYGSYVRIYDIPNEVATQLPRGEPGLSEYVFRYSVPERFRVMTLPKVTYLEALKYKINLNSTLAQKAHQAAILDSPETLIKLLKEENAPILLRGRRTTIAEIFSGPSGAKEGYNLEKHTLLGYKQLDELLPKFKWNEIHSPPNVDVKKTLRFAYALHDSGKPLAFELKSPDMHEEFSAEILAQVMTRAGFSKSEIDLGKALIGNDAIGLMIRGEMSIQDAFEQLMEYSKHTNLTPEEFFKVQSFYYAVDASSYPELKRSVFREEEGMLVPISEKYHHLMSLFHNVQPE